MAVTDAAQQHLLDKFYTDIATTGEDRLHITKQGTNLRRINKRQAASEISRFMRAMHGHDIAPETRILFHASPDYRLWIAEWSTIASHCVAVITPHTFSTQELLFTLAESKSKLVIVDTLEVAKTLSDASAKFPDLKYIICFEGGKEANIPILSWEQFMESGEETADRSGAMLRSINPKDTAILFYYKDEHESLQATRYSHILLSDHARQIDLLLGNSATIHKDETVLTVTPWAHIVGHIVSYYVPVLKEASMQVTDEKSEAGLLEGRPHIIIGNGAYLDKLKQMAIEHVKNLGPGARKELDIVLKFGKLKYETGKLNPWQRLGYIMLRQTILKEVKELFGGRLRLFISVDDTVRYETQLFFETFGVELVELPPDILKY